MKLLFMQTQGKRNLPYTHFQTLITHLTQVILSVIYITFCHCEQGNEILYELCQIVVNSEIQIQSTICLIKCSSFLSSDEVNEEQSSNLTVRCMYTCGDPATRYPNWSMHGWMNG